MPKFTLNTEQIRTVIEGAKAANDLFKQLHAEARTRKAVDFTTLKKERSVERQPTAACTTALNDFRTATAVGTSCRDNAALAVTDSTPEAARLTAVTAFCDANCHTTLTTSIRSVATACPRATVLTAEVRDFIWYVNFVCITDANQNRCVPRFWQAMRSLQAETSTTNPDWTRASNNFLTALCQPCTRRVLRVLAAFATTRDNSGMQVESIVKLGKLISLMCTRFNGEFCVTRWVTLANELNTNQGESQAAQVRRIVQTLCHPCTRIFVLKLAALFDGTEAALAILNALGGVACTKGEDGEYCLVKYVNSVGAQNPAPACVGFGVAAYTTCPAGCAGELEGLISNFGCCSNVIVGLSTQGNADQRNIVLGNIATCGVTIPEACGISRGTVAATILVNNMRLANWRARRAAIIAAISRDFRGDCGSDAITCSDPVEDTTNNSVSIDCTCETGMSGKGKGAVDGIATQVQDGEFANGNQAASDGGDNAENLTVPVSVAASNVRVVTYSAASSLTYSFATLFLLIAVVLF